jgi:hypothetical protein
VKGLRSIIDGSIEFWLPYSVASALFAGWYAAI